MFVFDFKKKCFIAGFQALFHSVDGEIKTDYNAKCKGNHPYTGEKKRFEQRMRQFI